MRKFLFLGLCGLFAAGFTGCKDDVINNGPGSDDNFVGESAGYVSFNVRTDLSTRADNPDANGDFTTEEGEILNPGTTDEYELTKSSSAHLALFFGKKGEGDTRDSEAFYYGKSNLQWTSGPNDGENQEKVYTYVSKSRYGEADTPDYVILLLNMEPSTLQAINTAVEVEGNTLSKTLAMISKATDPNTGYYIDNGKRYFSMTNSVYLSEEADKSSPSLYEANQIMTAPKVSANLKPTMQEAIDAAMTVYVERIAAKHEVTFVQEDGTTDNHWYNPKPTSFGQEGYNGTYKQLQYVKAYPTSLEELGKENYEEQDLDRPTFDLVDWKVYIEDWDMNGLERNSFYFKNINPSNFSQIYPWKYEASWITGTDDATGNNQFFKDWNEAYLHRSYWAVDEHYLAGGSYAFGDQIYNYPTQYRDYSEDRAKDEMKNEVPGLGSKVDKEGDVKPTSLDYISYNQIGKYNPQDAAGKYRYTLENTFADAEGHSGYGPYRYATHVLLAANLFVNTIDEEATDAATTPTFKDKWQAYGYWFSDEKYYINFAYRYIFSRFADNVTPYPLLGTNNTTNNVTAAGKVLYTKSEGTDAYTEIAVAEAFQYFETIPAQVVHGDGKVIIAPKDGVEFYYKTVTPAAQEGEDETVTYTKLTTAQIQDIIYSLCEDTCQHFNGGMMYYAIPVQHNFGKSNYTGELKKITKDGKYPFGQFGVVRNHWYKFNIKEIQSIGIPVDNPDQPIIPDPEDEYYIAFDIRIIPWHIINNGDVTLGK